jgi:hypothetical protein
LATLCDVDWLGLDSGNFDGSRDFHLVCLVREIDHELDLVHVVFLLLLLVWQRTAESFEEESLQNGVFVFYFHRRLDLILTNNGNVLNDYGSVDDGSNLLNVSDWRCVNDWCLNWCLNSNSLRFRGGLNWCRWSLDWRWSLNWSMSESGEHDLQHPLNSETGNFRPRSVQVDVSSWFVKVRPNLSLCVQH